MSEVGPSGPEMGGGMGKCLTARWALKPRVRQKCEVGGEIHMISCRGDGTEGRNGAMDVDSS